ncbi:putative U4/U6 small nuclear ribonucleo protein Prp4 [Protomyces lactucae-debilis]|uniref:Putative U4/U6 small nuclear ribonucleo protein Prp4 n=1 Tax=Protomyces lactucae-debilis TaxID=2754530 RepID=A0A1Y2FDE5_PROLT|nr:putative U4/U6 small nuclear ribonucleoprotein Prp4 [Protomyces lactucae-debilis]ORY81939.1 putative U4/U6 small nuclear ribonucleo protein Prp4 [Protomyces lactucae-debilis]
MSIDYASLPEHSGFASNTQTSETHAAHQEFARRQRARLIAVPTDDVKIKQQLRERGEPIILFGEGPADRRDRLRYVLSLDQHGGVAEGVMQEDEEDQEEEYETAGSDALLHARRDLLRYSIPRAQARLARQRQEQNIPGTRLVAARKAEHARLKAFTSQGSQVAADRACSIARFSPDGAWIATGAWSGDVRIFDSTALEQTRRTVGHTDKVSGLAWHPQATLGQSPSALNYISGGGEGDVCLWSLQGSEEPLARLQGHTGRVARCVFHPSGKYIASASFDGTWRFWDAETTTELLEQEGHAHEVYALACQDDGALLASGGLDAIGRVWDLRSGKTIMVLDGHVKPIQGLDFSPDGYTIVSGSADDTIKVWDVRQVKCTQTLPAHKSLVSDVRFFRYQGQETFFTQQGQEGEAPVPRSGTFMASSGYDGAVNIWSTDDWRLIKTLVGPAEKKVMSVDISGDGTQLCSSGFDRTLRLWSR